MSLDAQKPGEQLRTQKPSQKCGLGLDHLDIRYPDTPLPQSCLVIDNFPKQCATLADRQPPSNHETLEARD